ncbi:hypothetical protein QRN89_11685 [Streptomyces chengbuensis]|uniref:hypothetical protein n=1 Tax=Streptomyces TaxID=1883 RepID=UPI0025B5DC77|nr:hypothetical protein [Streptomyces sp. HUAS CB01]WJY50421.1 hypothetical protein QRN89_11685 [Streptomyces sp. HUAS CB01]
MEPEKREQPAEPEGCPAVAIRIPVRIAVLVLVVPVRMLWDVLVVCGRALDRVVLLPLGRAFGWVYETLLAPVGRGIAWLAGAVATGAWWLCKALLYWPWLALGRYVVVPVATYGVAVPLVWLYRTLLTPAGHGLAWLYARLLTPLGRGVGLLLRAVLVWPWIALYRWVLAPVGHGLAWLYANALAPAARGVWTAVVWLARVILVAPVVFLYRWILAPVGRLLAVVGREIADAVGMAWRAAGRLSRAVGRALRWAVWNLLGRPAAWIYRNVCTPVGHFARDRVWAPARRAAVEAGRAARGALASARDAVRRARRDAWRALVGGPGEPRPGRPASVRARNLGGTQHIPTVPGVAPGPEISLHKRG